MSDSATKDASPLGHGVMLRAWQANVTRPGEKVVTFLSSAEGASGTGGVGSGSENSDTPPLREWSAAVDLIHEASEAIRVGEQRAVELEAQLEHVSAQASEEMRRLSHQVAIGEQRLARSEERARLAEARASDAEAWLVRLHDAAVAAFGAKSTHMTATTSDDTEAAG